MSPYIHFLARCDRRYVGGCLVCSNISFDYRNFFKNIWHFPTIARTIRDMRYRYQPYPSSGPGKSGAYATNLISLMLSKLQVN